MQKILIKNGIIVTLGTINQILDNHWLLIENGKIARLAANDTLADWLKTCPDPHTLNTIDANGRIVMPGFINTHNHFYSTLARGFSKMLPAKNFREILTNLWWRLDKALTTRDVYISALYASIDAIKHGTTTIFDHHASPNCAAGSLPEIAKAVSTAGLRTVLCYELSDRDGKAISQAGITENETFIAANRQHEFHKAMFGLHASFTLADNTLAEVANICKSLNASIHIHCAEDYSDEEWTHANCGLDVVARLNKFNLLGPTTICAHGVHLSDSELDLLAATDTIIVHNPQSNMHNSVGTLPLAKMLARNILVGLGTDAMTNNMLEELRSAIWLHKHQKHSSAFNDCIRLLTQNNAKIAQRFWQNNIGEIAIDAPADIIIFDYYPPTPLTVATFNGHLVFGLSQSQIDTTICGGNILLHNKQLTTLDELAITQEARLLAQKLWHRM